MGEPARKETTTTTVMATVSTRFVGMVEKQFAAEMGAELAFSSYEKTLAQHLFLKIDAQLKALEERRVKDNRGGVPLAWQNLNMQKLALDAVHRVSLGLDALVRNHIHPIPYLNGRTKQYDMDLRIGHMGKLYCHQENAVEKPVEIVLNLVHVNDVFKPLMKSHSREVESYEYDIPSPFDRGDVVGGFGYIVYQDPKKNRLILVDKRDFDKAKAAAKTSDFWAKDKWEREMQFKTLVHRVADKIPLDPKKINAKSYAYIEAQEAEEEAEREIEENANKDFIDINGAVDETRTDNGNYQEYQEEQGEHQEEGSATEAEPAAATRPRSRGKTQTKQQALESEGNNGPEF